MYQYVKTTVEVKLLPVNFLCQIRPVQTSDEPRLISLYSTAFRDSIEYCDWKPKKVEDSAINNIKDFFIGKWGRPLPASRAAVCAKPNGGDEYIVGAALISEKQDGQPVLDMLFVAPGQQRTFCQGRGGVPPGMRQSLKKADAPLKIRNCEA